MIGTRLAQYEILERLGAGGMGEVWRARDTSLDREVAIKILPELFARDTERVSRFEREAKLLASLNHPGIAVLHGLHEEETTAGAVRFLAMELVPGEDLSRRLSSGPLSIEQSLFVAVQVAEALEAAHAQGVIHRDLKPANIVLTPDGKAKVLDFGLAKASETAGASSTSLSPTMTSDGTVQGVILGTAAYMSPEQTRGRVLDRRTDIWSFGCVLYECLTGIGLYRGESVSDSLGAILHKEPDWSLLPAGTPPTVRLLLRRCLTKNADKRLHDIADARIELAQAIEDPSGTSMGLADVALTPKAGVRPGIPLRAVAAAAVVTLAAGLLAGWTMRGGSSEAPLRKLDLGLKVEVGNEPPEVAISPDGTQIVATSPGGLIVQSLDSLEPRLLDGTEDAFAPFWSPDGEEIGFFSGQKLWKIPPVGGRGVAICDLGGPVAGGRGASWGDDGRIVFARGNTGLFVVSALGGEPRELLPLTDSDGDLHEPHVLPGGKDLLFIVHPEAASPGVLSLLHDGQRSVLLSSDSERFWSPVYAHSGHVLFRRSGGDVTAGLWALSFSLDAMQVEGEPFLVVSEAGAGSVSRDGTLAFVHRPPASGGDQLVWVDGKGVRIETIGGERESLGNPSVSPDGRRVAFGAEDPEDGQYELWIRDLARGTETRMTFEAGFEFNPIWTPDGDEFVFSRFVPNSGVTVQAMRADGSGTPRILAEGALSALTPDGRTMIVVRAPEGEELGFSGPSDFWLVPRSEPGEPRLLMEGHERVMGSAVSPDGRWLAYEHERSGRKQVYLTRFPEATGRWQVSIGEGEEPRWGPRGDRLYFVEGTMLMEVSVAFEESEPRLGRPAPLFDLARTPGFNPRGYSVSPEGDRFAIVEPIEDAGEDDASRPGIKIVQNWTLEFER